MSPAERDPKSTKESCRHRYLTAFPGSGGWVCADCRVPMLSLVLPLPLPLIAQSINAVTERAIGEQS